MTPPFQAVMTGLDNPCGLAWGPEVPQAFRRTRRTGPTGVAATGPHDIALLGRENARVSIGLGNDPALRSTCGALGSMFGWLVQVAASGNWQFDVDVSAYEATANPDGSPVRDSNPYGLLAESGATIATEAGGNALLRIAANGSISRLAVFPSRTNSTRGTDSVPTSVALGPDAAYYVGELTGFVPGAANVWRVVPGQPPTVFESGFTTIIDITFGPDGSLYMLESDPGISGASRPAARARSWRAVSSHPARSRLARTAPSTFPIATSSPAAVRTRAPDRWSASPASR